MKAKTIHILQLYARDMNIYGDNGNVLAIKRRLEWYGYKPVVKTYNPGDHWPRRIDIIIGGGGQDSGQTKIQTDLLTIGPKLHRLAEADTPMLAICGLYQMFGKFFKTADGMTIEGIGLLDVETYGKSERLIGNIHTFSPHFGDIIGYENHSGQTFLGKNVEPLGQVRLGAGNNTEDATEGALWHNVIGSYLHGSLLPKNPAIADFLIQKAIEKRYGHFVPLPFDDPYTAPSRAHAFKRPR